MGWVCVCVVCVCVCVWCVLGGGTWGHWFVKSAMYAPEPASDALDPAPSSSRQASSPGSPAHSPVPIDALAVASCPQIISGLRPILPAAEWRGLGDENER